MTLTYSTQLIQLKQIGFYHNLQTYFYRVCTQRHQSSGLFQMTLSGSDRLHNEITLRICWHGVQAAVNPTQMLSCKMRSRKQEKISVPGYAVRRSRMSAMSNCKTSYSFDWLTTESCSKLTCSGTQYHAHQHTQSMNRNWTQAADSPCAVRATWKLGVCWRKQCNVHHHRHQGHALLQCGMLNASITCRLITLKMQAMRRLDKRHCFVQGMTRHKKGKCI